MSCICLYSLSLCLNIYNNQVIERGSGKERVTYTYILFNIPCLRWEFIKENKKVRKKKANTLSTKKVIKKRKKKKENTLSTKQTKKAIKKKSKNDNGQEKKKENTKKPTKIAIKKK